jgi:hypothetical protein
MNCGEWEERVALYAGGDLAAEDAVAVERHVAECAGCQSLLGGLRESQAWLREAHAEPVEAAHLVAVRARVLAELEQGPCPWWRLAWVGVASLATLVILTLRPIAPPLPPAPKIAVAPPAVEAPVRPPPAEARKREMAKPRARKTPQPSETLLVKLESNDPDVVIYWIAETKGEPK